MARTSSSAVGAIIDVDSSISLTPFIDVANDIVTDVCTDSSYSAAKLELIERWLAAHFYHIRETRRNEENVGQTGEKLRSKIDLGLDLTHYGQMAKVIDSAGNLSALDKAIKEGGPRTITVLWGGTGTDEGDDDTD